MNTAKVRPKVLISSAGRRGALVRLFQDAVAKEGGRVYAADAGQWSAACRLAHAWWRVPRCDDARFVPAVLELCIEHGINLVVPTIDNELPVFAANRAQFLEHGIVIAVSGPGTVSVACDKLATYRFLQANDLPTVPHYDPMDTTDAIIPFPLIVKPRFGSASKGVQKVDDHEALKFYLGRTDQPIVQRFANGKEFTVNFFVDHERTCFTAVPHWRVETRGGEVSKCITVRHQALIRISHQLAAAFPDAWGPMCFQAFVDDSGKVQIIEVNARFGGGYPIAHQAGANFVRRLLETANPNLEQVASQQWEEGVAMTRWDEAVFVTAQDVGQCA
jgi:carbamoyl-phosphate synthase large subunit